MTESKTCTCPSGDGSLRWPCPAHPAVDQADVAAKLTFINGRPAMCGCQVEYSDGGGEYSDVIYVTLCAKHSGSAILDLVATNRIALTPEYEGQWHADLYLDREIPLAKVEGATPAEAVLALMSAERIDPEQESVEQAGGDERKLSDLGNELHNLSCSIIHENEEWAEQIGGIARELWNWPQARAALAQPSPAQAEAERPEVAEVAFVLRNIGAMDAEDIDGDNVDLRFEDAEGRDTGCDVSIVEYAEKAADLLEQQDRIVGALRADRDSWAEQAEQRLADWDEMRKERDAALARVAELERQEPVALANRGLHAFWVKWTEAAAGLYGPGIKLYAAPVAQAQHSVPETINEEANSFLRIADAGQFKDNAVAVRTAAVIIRGLLHRPALMQSIIRHRIGLTPEYEGQWHADLYGEDGEVQHHAEADTPDEAVRAVVALAAAPGKEGV
ncbi:hypothetical protein ACM736_28210 [Pseudomonas aeruginosa]